jgi:hypothetical protein
MQRIRRRIAKHADTVFEMWVFIDKSESMNIPRSRTDETGVTVSEPTTNEADGT